MPPHDSAAPIVASVSWATDGTSWDRPHPAPGAPAPTLPAQSLCCPACGSTALVLKGADTAESLLTRYICRDCTAQFKGPRARRVYVIG